MIRKPSRFLVHAGLIVLSVLLVLSGLTPAPRKAYAASSVTLTSHTSGERVSGDSIRLSGSYANVYDIRLFLNGERQVSVWTEDPDRDDSGTWYYDLDIRALSGEQHLTVRGLDTDTRYGVWGAPLTLYVDNPSAGKPAVSILSPADGATVSGGVPVRVSVQSPQPVARVQVRVNSGAWQDAVYDGTDYVFGWDSSGQGDRTHSIEAKAVDEAGTEAWSGTVYVKTGLGANEPFRMELQDRAMWIWESESYKLLLNPGSRGVLDAFSKDTDTFGSDPVTTFYMAVGPYAGMDILEDDPGKVREFIEWAHARGYQVYACVAGGTSPPYMGAYARYHHKAVREIERIINYNLASDPEAKFDGINVDIEPYIAPEFKSEYPSLQLQHLDGLKKMIDRRNAAGINLPFGPAIPKWYDSSPQAQDITWNGSTKWLSEHIQDMSDYISIMDYRDTADGSAGITAGAQGEIAYANAIGKPRSVVVGVETLDVANSGDPETITFREEGRAHMEAELDKVYGAFGNEASFGGIAMHHYDSVRLLPDYWGPGGRFWQAPADSEPPTAIPAAPRLTPSATEPGTVQLNYGMAFDNTEIDRYVVYRSSSPGFEPGPATAVGTARGLSYTDTGLVPGTTYYYKVRARDTGGHYGSASPEASVAAGGSAAKQMILSGLHVTRSGTSATARMQLVDRTTGEPLAGAQVEGRFTYSGGRYVQGITDAKGMVAFQSEAVPAGRQIGFEPRRVKMSGYYWAQAYDRPHTAAVYPKSGLAALGISAGALEPGFSTQTSFYSVKVPHRVTALSVTPTAAAPDESAVLVNGRVLPSGAASEPVPLAEGDNWITVAVAGQDGEAGVYTLRVTREAPAETPENVFIAAEDATVFQNEPSVKRGSDPLLEIVDIPNSAGGGDRYAYLKFKLDGYPEPVQTAKLHFYVPEAPSASIPLTLYGFDGDAWTEANVNWNTRPLAGSQVLGTVTISREGWHSVDVTAFTQSQMGTDKTLTFRLMDPNTRHVLVKIHSKDHAENRPYLVVNPSDDAALGRLGLLEGELTPVFDPAVADYTATVTNRVYAATVVTAASEPHAVVTVNGTAVPKETGRVSVPLETGVNAVEIRVSAQDGTAASYRIAVTRELPDLADLKALTVPEAVLAPAFSPLTEHYSATVTNSVYALSVLPEAADPLAEVTVNGVPVPSGGGAVIVPLSPGSNTIAVQVKAQNGFTRTYTLEVTRKGSGNADLAGLELDGAVLRPAFRNDKWSYTASVKRDVHTIRITPTAADAGASVRLNGELLAGAGDSRLVRLEAGRNLVEIRVTAQDGTERVYRVQIMRAGPPSSP